MILNNFQFHHDRYEVKVKIPTYNLVVQDKKDEDSTFSVMPFDDIKSKVIIEHINDIRNQNKKLDFRFFL